MHYILKVFEVFCMESSSTMLGSSHSSQLVVRIEPTVVIFWDRTDNTTQAKRWWDTCCPVGLRWRCFQLSEGLLEYDLRTIKPDSLPFTWHHGLILAGSVLLCHALRFHWQPEETKHSRRIDGGPIHLRLKAAARLPFPPDSSTISRWDKQRWSFTIDVWTSRGFLLTSGTSKSEPNSSS